MIFENEINKWEWEWACLCLHNYLRLADNAFYRPAGFLDSFDETDNLKQGEWKGLVTDNEGLLPLNHVKGFRYPNQAVEMRNAILEFIISKEDSVSWQEQHVTRTEYSW